MIGGGSKGLGRACADSLAKEGANLVICSRNAENLDQTAKEIYSTYGVDVLPVAADLSRLEDIQTLIKATVDHFGRLDILVNNSGGPLAGRSADTTDEIWHQAIEMALMFFIRMSREAVPHMKQIGRAHV